MPRPEPADDGNGDCEDWAGWHRPGQPAADRAGHEGRRFAVPDCKADGAALSPPKVPWRMEITVAPTFVPREIDPTGSDNRHLGAVIDLAGFRPVFD